MATLFVDVMNFKFEMEKYDGKNNFRLWQVQVKDILIQRGLLKALKGKPSDMSADDWEDFDLQARNIILLCLTKEITDSVMHEKSATMIWSKLESLYTTRCTTSRVYLQMQLYSLRMKEGTSIQDHVKEFSRIDSELLNIEVQLEDEFKALILLASLPDSYDQLVAPLLSNKETIHYDEVKAALLLFDNNSQGKDLVINGRKKNRNPRKGRSRIN